MNPKLKNLLIRTGAGAVYIALMIGAVYVPEITFSLFLAYAIIGFYEFSQMTHIKEDASGRLTGLIFTGLLFAFSFFGIHHNVGLVRNALSYFSLTLITLFIASIIINIIRFKENPVEHVGNLLLGLIWIVLPLCLLSYWITLSPVQVLAFFILIWAADTFAYLGGSLLGKHKLCPRVSPGKTWEGFIISLILTIGLAILLNKIHYFNANASLSLTGWILFAAVITIFGLFGDLLESLFKRSANLKDSGNVIPGHGGVLDRLDSIFIAIYPAMLTALLFIIK